ncbi:hypothetical protein [Actinokineospora sp. HUAS TT18]|uniref:hypothetical protein n=1 Tax=Actinokineospora sp. HUAS TT18 TaxID=3447451 RepID=UPI003F5250EC
MMPDITRHAAVTSGFAELVCADAAWLRAEFDAIVTANFGVRPPCPPRPRPGSAGPSTPGPAPRADVAGSTFGGVRPTMSAGRRQRSPPLAERPCFSSTPR